MLTHGIDGLAFWTGVVVSFCKLRVVYGTKLGVDAMHQLDGRLGSNLPEITLRSITHLALEDISGMHIKHISSHMIISESADDVRLHNILHRILSGTFTAFVVDKRAMILRLTSLLATLNGIECSCSSRMDDHVDLFP